MQQSVEYDRAVCAQVPMVYPKRRDPFRRRRQGSDRGPCTELLQCLPKRWWCQAHQGPCQASDRSSKALNRIASEFDELRDL